MFTGSNLMKNRPLKKGSSQILRGVNISRNVGLNNPDFQSRIRGVNMRRPFQVADPLWGILLDVDYSTSRGLV